MKICRLAIGSIASKRLRQSALARIELVARKGAFASCARVPGSLSVGNPPSKQHRPAPRPDTKTAVARPAAGCAVQIPRGCFFYRPFE